MHGSSAPRARAPQAVAMAMAAGRAASRVPGSQARGWVFGVKSTGNGPCGTTSIDLDERGDRAP